MHAVSFFDFNTVQHLIQVGGYFVLFALLFACGLGFPLPEDIPLLLAGYFVAQPSGSPGKMYLLPAAVVAWTGIIGGDCVLYCLGRRYGLNITRLPLIGRHVTQSRIVWIETKFEKWGVGGRGGLPDVRRRPRRHGRGFRHQPVQVLQVRDHRWHYRHLQRRAVPLSRHAGRQKPWLVGPNALAYQAHRTQTACHRPDAPQS